MKRVLLLLCLLAAVAWAGQPNPLLIGAIYNLTGSQSALDISSSRGARLAVDDVNLHGGIRGQRLALRLEDGHSDPAVLKEKTRELVADDRTTLAVVGLSDTDMVLAAAPEAAAYRRVFLTSGATSPRLPGEVPTYLFLACFGDNVQAAAAAEWAYRQGWRKAVLVKDPNMEYTRLLSGYFTTRFQELGGTVSEGDPAGADLVFLAVGPDQVIEKATSLRSGGYEGPILGGDSLDVPGWELDKIYFTTHAYLDQHQDFVERYTAAFGEPPDAFSALGYDSVMLLSSALTRAGTRDLTAILHAMEDTREFHGLTGTLRYDEGQRIPRKSVFLVEADHSQRKLVEEVLPEKVPAP